MPSRRKNDAKEPPAIAKRRERRARAAAPPPPAQASDVSPSEQSAAGLINRLRRSLSPSQGESETPAPLPQAGWLERLRGSNPAAEDNSADKVGTAIMPPLGDTMPKLSTNDLRAYLNQRLASRSTEAANDFVRKSDATQSKSDATKSDRCSNRSTP